jgi:hypothetical protein
MTSPIANRNEWLPQNSKICEQDLMTLPMASATIGAFHGIQKEPVRNRGICYIRNIVVVT